MKNINWFGVSVISIFVFLVIFIASATPKRNQILAVTVNHEADRHNTINKVIIKRGKEGYVLVNHISTCDVSSNSNGGGMDDCATTLIFER